MEHLLVSDFDGTITRHDFYLLIRKLYMSEDAPEYFELYRQGQMGHFEAMAAYFSHAPGNEEVLASMLPMTEPDPSFAESVHRLRTASWDLTIVSAGSSWYIERILRQLGITATVYSNPGTPRPDGGLVIERPPNDAPFYSAEVGVDKSAVVRDALQRYEKVAFAGDGPPDLAPALLVRPEFRFARGYLADTLASRKEDFVAFENWSEIVDRLAE